MERGSQERTPERNAITLKEVGCVRCAVYSSKNADPAPQSPIHQSSTRLNHRKTPKLTILQIQKPLRYVQEMTGRSRRGLSRAEGGSALSKGALVVIAAAPDRGASDRW